MRRHFLVLHNPHAGRKNGPLLKDTLARLEQEGCTLDLIVPDHKGHDKVIAAKAADKGEVDAVVAAGGDSTVRRVAKGLAGCDMPLGIIPMGTGNVLNHEIGLKREPDAVADTLMNGDIKPVRFGLANGEKFLLMAGTGFDAQVVGRLDHKLKQRIYKAAYIWPVMKALAAGPQDLTVEIAEDRNDDENSWNSYAAGWVVITKGRLYGGRFVLAPDADLSSDEFQVVMFMDKTRLGMAQALIGLVKGKNAELKETARHNGKLVGHITATKGVMIRPAKAVRITAPDPVPTQIDGELLGITPLDISMAEEKVRIIVPAG